MSLNLNQRLEEKDLNLFRPKKIKKLGLIGKLFLGLGLIGFSSVMNSCAIDESAQRNNNQNRNTQQEEPESDANILLGLIAAGIFNYTDLDPALKNVLETGSGVVYNQQLQEQRNNAIRNSGGDNNRQGNNNQNSLNQGRYTDDLLKKMSALGGTDYWVDFNGTIFKKAPESFICLGAKDLNKNNVLYDYYDLIGLKSIFTIDEIKKNSNCLYFGFMVNHAETKKVIFKIKNNKGEIEYVYEEAIPYEIIEHNFLEH